MLLFRSEAHLDRWLDGRPAGAILPLTQLARLADAWWSDRLAADWQPHSREQNQAILESVGLTGDFWRLG
jgi:hypothetical protein